MRGAKAENLLLSGSILIIAPHPDDEAIGCGGLIARLCATGNTPHVAILSGGGCSHRGCCDIEETEVIDHRRELTLQSARVLGLPQSNIHTFDFIDGHIDDLPSLQIKRLKALIDEIKPETIFVPHFGEGWPDHLVTRQLGLDLAPVGTYVYEYCVWMWYYNVWKLDWSNARKILLTPNEYNIKLRAVKAYVTPTAPCGKPWSGVLPAIFLRANTTRTELYFIHRH